MANREDLLTLRNDLIQRELGNILLAYLQDYVTEQAVKNLDATEIKGMCRLNQQIKDIPKEVDKNKEHLWQKKKFQHLVNRPRHLGNLL